MSRKKRTPEEKGATRAIAAKLMQEKVDKNAAFGIEKAKEIGALIREQRNKKGFADNHIFTNVGIQSVALENFENGEFANVKRFLSLINYLWLKIEICEITEL